LNAPNQRRCAFSPPRPSLIAYRIKHHPTRPDDESSVAAVLFRLPAKPSVPFPISFGSRIIGQAADVIPVVDLPLHLPLDRRRSAVFPRRLHLRPKPLILSPLSGGLRTSCLAFVPALALFRIFRPRSRFVDKISALVRAPSLQPSRRRNPQVPLGQSCLRPKPLTRLPLLPLPVASPAEPRLASSFLRISQFGLADLRSPLFTGCCRACSAGDETPHATELCIACRTGDESSGFPRILHPAARAAKRISDFHRTFHLPV
jgi:hypothetical protein